jgi:hypothetical protein
MKGREKIFQVKKKTGLAARKLYVSLDRADNVIEGESSILAAPFL